MNNQSLLENQQKAVNKLSKYKVGALFMEPGTGKTRTVLELLRGVDTDYILWFTPFQTKKNLKNEISKWANADNIEIVGIESISNSDRIYLELYNKVKNANKPTVICDESLKIKNHTSKRTMRALELGKMSEYRLILNGTPMTRDLLDIWSQFEFLSPKILRMRYAQFKDTFCNIKEVTIKQNNRSYSFEKIESYANIDYLHSLIRHYIFHCDLSLSLSQYYHEEKYRLRYKTEYEYKKLKEKYLDDKTMMFKNNNIFLEMTQKMQHLYCVEPEKFQIVRKIIEENQEYNIIIYCKYIRSSNLCKRLFPNVKVLSYQKSSYGLNLQDYNCIIFFDKIWDYALREQATRRIYRQGQEKDCYYYDLTGNVGLDELIKKNVTNKVSMSQYVKEVSIKQMGEDL